MSPSTPTRRGRRCPCGGRTRSLVVAVADDGRGGANPRGGSGLVGLTDRVEALRGTLEVTSAGASGTTLRAAFPLG